MAKRVEEIVCRRHRLVCEIVALICCFLMTRNVVAKDTLPKSLGIVSSRPVEGPYVETEFGFLIAYSQTIPGTDIAFEMVPIPEGTFLLGSPIGEEGRLADEGPQIEVVVMPLWVGKYEVTWAEYKQYMQLCRVFEQFDDRGIRQVLEKNKIDAVTAPSKLYEPSFTFSVGDGPRNPAVSMSQYAAKQYTKWLSLLTRTFYRLPTEIEWEYACRAGTTTAYSFGDDPGKITKYAWYYENADDKTHPVGEKLPNAWGLYDMHGNASEWVLDTFEPAWYKTLESRKKPVTVRTAICQNRQLFPRVLRGGSWNLDPTDCRCAKRRPSHDDDWRSYDPNVPKSPWWFASDQSQDVGFRIIRPLLPITRETQEQFWETDVPAVHRVVDHRIENEGRGERGLVDPTLPEAIKDNLSR